MAQPYPTLEEYNYIGKRRLRSKDGYAKASGEAIFTKDVFLPGMLYAKWLLSPYTHARIISMDTSKAEALEGVWAVLRWDDPELTWDIHPDGKGATYGGILGFAYGNFLHREWAFTVGREACYFGQQVGVAVAAESPDICDEALKLVEIEWEQLPFILDHKEAAQPGAPIVMLYKQLDDNMTADRTTEYGDVEAGFAEADKIIEFSRKTGLNSGSNAETWDCVATWQGDYIDIFEKGQHCHTAHINLAQTLPTEMNKIRIRTPYSGCSFGGVANSSLSCIEVHCATLLAKKAGRPVKLDHTHSHWWTVSPEYGYYDFKVGVKNDGTITAVDGTTWLTPTYGPIGKMHECTKIQNFRWREIAPYTNTAFPRCYRHGAVACICTTLVFEHAAAAVDMDPTEVALINDGVVGHDWDYVTEFQTEHGFPVRHSLEECLEVGKAAIDWDNKWHAPGTKMLPNGKMHGLGLAHNLEWTHTPGGTWAGGDRIAVVMHVDGTLSILGQMCDIGVGQSSTLSRVAADEVGMRYEDVDHRQHDDVGLKLVGPGGSSSAMANTYGLVRACREARRKLLEMATGTGEYSALILNPFFPGMTPEQLDVKESVIFEKANPENKKTVAEVVYPNFRDPVMAVGDISWPERPAEVEVMCRQTHFVEVEVDTDTGEIEVTKVVNVNDVGKILNPEALNGQQYGGSYMGLGRGGKEEVFYDPQTGIPLNRNFIGYPFLSMNDVGPIDCHLVETGGGYCVYGAYGIGENLSSIVAILGPALYNATGVWLDDYPLTPDRVLKALGKA